MSKELIERLRNTTYHNLDPYEAADRIEQLQRRIEYLELCCDEGERQLAASQAREQQLRDALDNHSGNYKLSKEECKRIDALLDAPSDTTALESLIAKAGEVMRERCVEACNEYDNRIEAMRDCEYQAELAGRQAGAMRSAAAIRALPGVTLDDLKGGAA